MAVVGDRVQVPSKRVGQAPREGIVMGVSGALLRVAWSSGEESTIMPSMGSLVVVGRAKGAGPAHAAAGDAARQAVGGPHEVGQVATTYGDQGGEVAHPEAGQAVHEEGGQGAGQESRQGADEESQSPRQKSRQGPGQESEAPQGIGSEGESPVKDGQGFQVLVEAGGTDAQAPQVKAASSDDSPDD